MGLVKLSSELTLMSSVELENIFILEYMPYAPESYSKVYIYGKMLASSGIEYDNSVARIAKLLGMTEDEVLDAFSYWHSRSLVSILQTDPFEVEYLPVRTARYTARKFSKTKYTPFNEQLMKMLPHRDFTPSEYNEYYSVMEDYHIDINSMLLIFSYCVRMQGPSVGWKYIVAVARNLAKDGCRTEKDVELALSGMSIYEDALKQIFKTLKIRRKVTIEDSQFYKTWTKEYGYEINALLRLASQVFTGEMKGLDALVRRYRALGMTTLESIDKHIAAHDELIALTKEILIKLDVRFTRLDHYAETYVEGWLKKGFTRDALLLLADYCFRHERKSCEKMSSVVDKFENLGLFTGDEITDHFAEKLRYDADIKNALAAAQSDKRVSSRDREIYKQWQDWGLGEQLIEYAATLAKGMKNPFAYMNKILLSWEENGIKTVEDAKKFSAKKVDKQATHSELDLDAISEKLMSIKLEDI